jgi:hypothetical protein
LNIGFVFLGLFFALTLQGVTAAINPHFNETFFGAIGKSINQLSMNTIRFSGENNVKNNDNVEQNSSQNTPQDTNEKSDPAFDGYVPESTDVRVNLSKIALQTWRQNAATMLFGVGLGGAGVAMADFTSSGDAREIVQNEYVEILLERGIIGAILFADIVIGLLFATKKQKWFWAIIAAFLFQWLFFSGLPNALHIYLILIILFLSFCTEKTRS